MNGGWALGGAAAGLIAGSFLATLALRWGRGASIAHGRSRCDGCGVTIPPAALVPLASYLWLRGRCGACRSGIDWRHPAMEGACALTGLLALGMRPGADVAAGALFGWLLLTLALLDLDHFWLPDRLTLPLGAAGAGAGLLGLAPPLEDRLIGAAAGFLVLAAIGWAYARTRGRIGLGGGDPKLFGAIGAWLGWAALPLVLLAACLLGLGWCLLLVARGRPLAGADRLPLGTLLALAAWPFWLSGAALLP